MFENLILAEFLEFFCSPKLWRKGVHIWHNNHDDEDNDNGEKQLVLWAKQQLCTCITPFSTFLWRPPHEYEVKSSNATFYRARERTATNFPVSFWTRIKSWELASTKIAGSCLRKPLDSPAKLTHDWYLTDSWSIYHRHMTDSRSRCVVEISTDTRPIAYPTLDRLSTAKSAATVNMIQIAYI